MKTARRFGEQILLFFDGTGWRPGALVFLNWQDGKQTQVVRTSEMGWLLEDTRKDPEVLIVADLETQRYRVSPTGSHDFVFPELRVKALGKDGVLTYLAYNPAESALHVSTRGRGLAQGLCDKRRYHLGSPSGGRKYPNGASSSGSEFGRSNIHRVRSQSPSSGSEVMCC